MTPDEIGMSQSFDPTAISPIVDGATEGEEVFEVDITVEPPVPAGIYGAQLTDLHKDVSQSGNDMWVWEFTICEGPHAGKKLAIFTALTQSAAWKLAQVVRGLALPMQGNKVRFTPKEAVGRYALILTSVGSYQGQPRANIDNVKPWPDERPKPASLVPDGPFAP